MTKEEKIIEKLALMPEEKKQEVLDFSEFILHKIQQNNNKPVFGSSKGKYILNNDFDEPLEDFKEYMS